MTPLRRWVTKHLTEQEDSLAISEPVQTEVDSNNQLDKVILCNQVNTRSTILCYFCAIHAEIVHPELAKSSWEGVGT